MPRKSRKSIPSLEAVLRVSQTIAASLDLRETSKAVCQAAVELLGVDHSSLVLLSPDNHSGRVSAEYPELGVRDLEFRFAEISGYRRLVASPEPIFIPDVRNTSALGVIKRFLLKLDVRSILIIPIRNHEELLGYLTLDTIGRVSEHDDRQMELWKTFAAQVVVAIRNSQLYEETKRRADQLDFLRQTTLAVTSELDLDTLLKEIIEKAQGLLKAKNGGIFEYRSGSQDMMVIVDSSPGSQKKGVTLREGEGMAGRLMRSAKPYMIVDNYEEWSGQADVDMSRRPAGAVLEVKIVWQRELIGTIYVEDEVPRKFTKEDAQLLSWFADQAGIAMSNAKLVKHLKEGNENLRNLDLAARSLFGQVQPEEILKAVAERAQKSMEADSATIWPFDKSTDRFLPTELVAVGISPAELEEFRSQDPPLKGISRAVLRKGWLGIEDLATANVHYIRNSPRTELLLRLGIKSFQGVALRVGHEPVGVLYLNYNRARRFQEEDRRRIELLASDATLALVIVRNAQLYVERAAKLRVQRRLAELSKQFLTTLQRQQILDLSVEAARELLESDRCSIVLPDHSGDLLVAAEDGSDDVLTGKFKVERGEESQSGHTILTGQAIRVRDYQAEKSFSQSGLLAAKGLKSGMSVPIFDRNKVIGSMNVHSREYRDFTGAEEETLSLIANQATSALERLDEITRKDAYFSALFQAIKAIDEESGRAIQERKFDSERILQEIVKQAVRCLVDSHGQKASVGTLRFYNAATHQLSLDSVYPPVDSSSPIAALIRKSRCIKDVPPPVVGYAGWTALNAQALLIPDVRQGPLKDYYYELVPSTQSELVVPMLSQKQVIGVLNVESDRLDVFDETDKQVLQSLADFAVIALNNADQYKELRKTDKLVDARSKVAFMGMASSIWGHSIRGATNSIRELVRVARSDLKHAMLLPGKRNALEEKLTRIHTLTEQILERPIIEPLGSDRGVVSSPIRGLIQERVRLMRWPNPFGTLDIKLPFDAGEVSVLCNPQWLRRALDIVLDNAAKALLKVDPSRRSLTVRTTLVGDKVEIAVSDTGPGIPPEFRDVVLNAPVKHSGRDGGSGIGLLMAQTIINAYSGEIEVASTGDSGTTVVISLPVENSGAASNHFHPRPGGGN